MSSVQDCFALHGIDYAATMPRFGGNEALYLRLLPMLFADESLGQLSDCLQRGDLTSAFEAAHALKGVAGNLGLGALYTAADALVEPLRIRQSQDYTALYERVFAELGNAKAFCEALKGAGELV